MTPDSGKPRLTITAPTPTPPPSAPDDRSGRDHNLGPDAAAAAPAPRDGETCVTAAPPPAHARPTGHTAAPVPTSPEYAEATVYRWAFARVSETAAQSGASNAPTNARAAPAGGGVTGRAPTPDPCTPDPPGESITADIVTRLKLPPEFQESVASVAEKLKFDLPRGAVIPAEPWLGSRIASRDWGAVEGLGARVQWQAEVMKWYDSAYLMVAAGEEGPAGPDTFRSLAGRVDGVLPVPPNFTDGYENDLYRPATCLCAQLGNPSVSRETAAALVAELIQAHGGGGDRAEVRVFFLPCGVLGGTDFLRGTPLVLFYYEGGGSGEDVRQLLTGFLPDLLLAREKLRMLRRQYARYRSLAEAAARRVATVIESHPGRDDPLEAHESHAIDLQAYAQELADLIRQYEYDANALVLNRRNLRDRLRDEATFPGGLRTGERTRLSRWMLTRIDQQIAQLRGDRRYHRLQLEAADRAIAALGDAVASRNAIWTRRATIVFSVLSFVLAVAGIAQSIDAISKWGRPWPAVFGAGFVVVTLMGILIALRQIRAIPPHPPRPPSSADAAGPTPARGARNA